jgi:hypothetical protein
MISSGQDWRLETRLDAGPGGSIGRHLHRVHADDVADDVRAIVEHDVVVTHDGRMLFAYGATESMLRAARAALDAVLERRQLAATVIVSRWDDALGSWRQIDPPPAPDLELSVEAAVRTAEAVETRTLVCVAGKLVRARFEQTMLKSASILGIECRIAEHARLLTTQVSFTVTGPRAKLDRFRVHLVAQGWATIRADGVTMNPTS